MSSTLVFVFGTLKEGFPNFATNRGKRVAGDFQTKERLPLYLVGDRRSPWLMLSPGQGSQILGQVFEVSEPVLNDMDRLERIGEPDGYRRVGILVQRVDSPETELLVQAYLKPPEQLHPSEVAVGPFSEYTLEHAALYRPRAA